LLIADDIQNLFLENYPAFKGFNNSSVALLANTCNR